MKNLFALLSIAGLVMFTAPQGAMAQADENATTEVTTDAPEQDDDASLSEEAIADSSENAESAETEGNVTPSVVKEKNVEEGSDFKGIHQEILKQFIDGGPLFMSFVLACLILGLALAIERIIYLNMATTNTTKLLEGIEEALEENVEAAKEVCRNTRGPVASIFHQGLDRSSGTFEEVAKAIEDYGSVEMTKLERGLSWISLFIALAPMLGFMGTVLGMIDAFNDIEGANTINASLVAGGIKVALITTVSGLIVAIILQIFYNYILSKIDSIVLDMEEASMDLVDLLYKRNLEGKK